MRTVFKYISYLGTLVLMGVPMTWADIGSSAMSYSATVVGSASITTLATSPAITSASFFGSAGTLIGSSTAFTASSTFGIQANSAGQNYTLWVTVPNSNNARSVLSKGYDQAIAIASGPHYLPVNAYLTGGNVTAYLAFAEPSSGGPTSGYHEHGATMAGDTTYTLRSWWDTTHVVADFPNQPAGNYTLVFTVNLAVPN